MLIVGATGGVGTFAVQLAGLGGRDRDRPAHAEDRDFLEALGASEVPDAGLRPPPMR